ncbi:MAG TPA: GyrI-like domain-containing protein, partial [Lachnospiraceae bacterium]|nr:GyrI-like domain-containing protein [Lachnospiraceae bacterium]
VMMYQVEVREMESLRVAFIKYRGIAMEANKLFPKVFQAIKGKANGAPFIYFHTFNPDTKMGEMDLCVPTEMEPFGNGVDIQEISGTKVLCTTHVGPYDLLDQAYEAINQYAMKKRIRIGTPYREIYLKGPGILLKGNPDKYITEIAFPVKED